MKKKKRQSIPFPSKRSIISLSAIGGLAIVPLLTYSEDLLCGEIHLPGSTDSECHDSHAGGLGAQALAKNVKRQRPRQRSRDFGYAISGGVARPRGVDEEAPKPLSICYQEEEAEARRNKPAWHSPLPLWSLTISLTTGWLGARPLQSSRQIGGTALVLSEPDERRAGQREARKGRRYSGIGGCWWKRG
jgi:hypothetical protein